MRKAMLLAGLLGLAGTAALADEQVTPLAASGSWIAFAHATSMTAGPDVCAVWNPVQNVGFRAGTMGIEFRAINTKWSLPTNVAGKITIAVGPISQTLDIGANDDQSVSAMISSDELLPLFAAMDKAPSMQVTIGHDKPLAVSLVGSTKATNAFRTCAHINSSAPGAGSNPFQ